MDDTNNSNPSGETVEVNSEDDLINSLLDDDEKGQPEALEEDAPVEVEVEVEDEADAPEQAESTDLEFDVKVDGKEKKVPLSELLKSYEKGSAADGRFREAAELRKQLEPELQKVRTERDQLNQLIATYTERVNAHKQTDQPDWETLLNENPAEFVRQKHAFDVKQQDLKTTADIQSYLNQQRDAENQKQRDAFVQAETQKLIDAIPAWKDKTKAVAESAAVSKYLGDLGFNAEAQSSIIDHRLILISRKAMLYDQAVSKQKAAGGAVKPVTRSERPNTVSTQPSTTKQAAEKAFKKNPSKDTLAELLM